ncbi:MAG TPA: hypothetical protein PKZ36_01265 [Candidatus Paceibacterota bacterium]|nr:hypothetical protein [Candidatus Paceibacterota bacterium]HPT18019.1 hypothetical protein [Candidatus Paceibacterota bacterium]
MESIFKNKILGIFLVVILIFTVIFTFSIVFATSAELSMFGGRIVSTQSCTCSDGYQVTVTGPSDYSGTYLYSSASEKRAGTGIPGGSVILGKYSQGGECLITGDPCTELPITKGTIGMFGTN